MPASVVMISGSLRKRSFNSALMHSLPKLAPGLTMVEAPSYGSFPLTQCGCAGKFRISSGG